MEEIEYLDEYEKRLEKLLAGLCGTEGGMFLVEELEERWKEDVPEYMVDAVSQINHYPAFTLAVAGFYGMALAALWDTNWEAHKNDSYVGFKTLGGGFDTVDEYILEHILDIKPDSHFRTQVDDMMRTLSHTVMTAIQHENIEHQTTRAFYILARSAKVMFRAGVTFELRHRGYHYEKLRLEDFMPKNNEIAN